MTDLVTSAHGRSGSTQTIMEGDIYLAQDVGKLHKTH